MNALEALGHIGPTPKTVTFLMNITTVASPHSKKPIPTARQKKNKDVKPQPQERLSPYVETDGEFFRFWQTAVRQIPYMGDERKNFVPTLVQILNTDIDKSQNKTPRRGWDYPALETIITVLGEIGRPAEESIPVLRHYLGETGGLGPVAEASIQKIKNNP
jgi:hypothetical protein